jgi:hypothetical protein
MNAITAQSLDAQILSELIAPDRPTLSASAARGILDFSFTKAQKKEIEQLLDLNGEGEISDAQRQKLEAYVRIDNFLSLRHAKARISLLQSGAK